MPTYNAKCEKCDLTFEYNASILHEESPPCVNCQGETERALIKNETGFILKGDGFFKSGGFN
jgi:putative FmdB family regulatory protein